jgi:hypothetical protein
LLWREIAVLRRYLSLLGDRDAQKAITFAIFAFPRFEEPGKPPRTLGVG